MIARPDTAPAPPLLDVRGLGMTYGGAVAALRDVDLHVDTGSVVALLGSNGAGKSSLLRAVSGNLHRHRARTTGRITFAGEPLPADPAACVRRGVVQVPEGRRIFTGLTIAENLTLAGLVIRDRSRRRAALATVRTLFPFLADRRAELAGGLSGGEQQMLAIGRALMAEPRLLMLDEPSLGLAPKAVADVASAVRRISDAGTSVLLIEQNASLALSLADHVYVLELGRLAHEGAASDPHLMEIVARLYLGQHDGAPSCDLPEPATPALSRWVA